jgi:MoaA/NifB/PqqE/SkfB family radical SAM enzyme
MKINQRLFDHYGIDTRKDLKIQKRCPNPFDTILIDKRGSCYACECTAWLPQSIGNLQVSTLEEIIGSSMHQHIQSTIEDGSYRYCNQAQCSRLRTGVFRQGSDLRYIRLAIDDSCNLRCPSCRKDLIFHTDGSQYNTSIKLADRVNDWLASVRGPVQVHIGSDGDPFASHVYRHFMRNTPERQNIRYSMLTNGLMFEEFHGSIPHVIGNLDELGISIDGASKDTYEQLRLGGRWDKINKNLHSVAEAKTKNGFLLSLHMVVQQANHHELDDMLSLAEKFGADKVYFNKIQDWNTGIDFSRQIFTDTEAFRESLKRVVTKHHPITGCAPFVHNSVISI